MPHAAPVHQPHRPQTGLTATLVGGAVVLLAGMAFGGRPTAGRFEPLPPAPAPSGAATFTAAEGLEVSNQADCAGGYQQAAAGFPVRDAAGGMHARPGQVTTGSICVHSTSAAAVRWGLQGAVTDDVGGALQRTVKWRLWAQAVGMAAECAPGLTADGSDAALAVGAAEAPVRQAALAPARSPAIAAWPTQLLARRNGAPEVVVQPDPRTALAADASYQKLCFSLLLPAGPQAPQGSLSLRFTLTAAPG